MENQDKVLKLFETHKPKDFGVKNWNNQPAYFEYIASNIDFSTSEHDLFMEFGVFTGYTFELIRRHIPDSYKMYGFDAFLKGLPESWAGESGITLQDKGAFAQTELPTLYGNSEYISGYVEDTLIPFLETHNEKIKLVHIDLDLYQSTKFVLNAIKHRFVEGTIIILDDFYNFTDYENFVFKAFAEVLDSIESKFDVVPIATAGWVDGWASAAFKLEKKKVEKKKANVTIVTGLWDLGRGQLDGWAQRDFEAYKQNFFKLLEADIPMCIWIPKELEQDVWAIRKRHNTKVMFKENEEFKTWFPFYEKHESIRTNPDWFSGAGWLPQSPQAALELYNPMMMSKMFMVNDSALINPFNTEYFYWIDGGLASTVAHSYFLDGTVFENVALAYKDTLVNISYPYEPNNEIHGFNKKEFFRECNLPENSTSVKISRGGFWGGPKAVIHEYNSIYYNILDRTIHSGNIGADECIFTIAAYNYPDLIERFEIESNGLVWPFFDAMSTNNIDEFIKNKPKPELTYKNAKTSLYILGFNSPSQFSTLCQSIEDNSPALFKNTRKILINNSTDVSLFEEYDILCKRFGFEEIHFQENLGICGGRQYVAEHFDASDADFYIFLEDDLVMHPDSSATCRVGLRTHVPNLYEATLKIMIKEKFDFLKLCFSEFYASNNVQISWYNVPQSVRTSVWPHYDKLPHMGFDPNCPLTTFKNINSVDNVGYISGEIYYSNWPILIGKEGNRKMFIDNKFAHPFEQSWMSQMYQDTIAGKLRPAILLATPFIHDRTDFYKDGQRKEN